MMEEEEDGDVEEVEGGGGGGTAKLKRLDTPPRCTDLIVLGLPYKTTQEQFKNYFEQFGKVAAAELKRDRQGNSKGFGFVQMESYDAQLSVLAQHTHVIDGRKCQVKIPNSKQGLEYAQICKIFVGRLVEKWSQEDLRRFFAAEAEKINPQCQVTDVFIPRPFRAFGFVTFSHSDVAQTLIKQSDIVMDGHSLSVSLAAPKESDPPPPPNFPRSSGYSYSGNVYPPHRGGDFGPSHYGGGGGGGYSSGGGPYNHDWDGPSFHGGRNYGGPRGRAYIPPSQQALTNGFDALNLNQRNPEVLNAAWSAFFNTIHGSQSPGQQKW